MYVIIVFIVPDKYDLHIYIFHVQCLNYIIDISHQIHMLFIHNIKI
jgi:hypothetical protein